jgi:hypothetical protein
MQIANPLLEPEMRKQMEIEDGILGEFEDMQREIMQQRQEIAEVKLEIGIERQKATEAEREAAEKIAEVERDACESRKKVARNLKKAGVVITIIMQATGLSQEEVVDI